jgi:uncharacterized protein
MIIENDEDIQKMVKLYPEISRYVIIVAWLHDVRDHKYPESISQEDLDKFIRTIEPDEKMFYFINKVIRNISWSKEANGQRENYDKTFDEKLNIIYQIVLNIVGDADRLEALGKIGIERCETFTRKILPNASEENIIKNVITHCFDKLLRILPEGYIKTSYGKILAEPLHKEIEDFVKKYN